jgi:excinuclease ABC subunit A
MIRVLGARERNLQGVELSLDPGALTVFSGVSGSGKSSLAFDTLHAEGRRRLADALSPGAAAGALRRPAVDAVSGLPPTLAVAQRGGTVADRRTTVGTLTDITPLLRVLYARAGEQRCPTCDAVITPQSPEAIIAALQALPAGTRLTVMGPRVRREVGSMSALLRGMLEAGFVRARVDGVVSRIEDLGPLDARAPHDVDVVVDRIRAGPDKADRLAEAARLGLAAGRGRLVVDAGGEERFYAEVAWCGRCQREWPPLSQRLLSFSSPEGACQGCGGLGVVEVDGGERTCGDCGGGRLGPAGAAVKLGGLSLPQRSAAPLGALALPEALAAGSRGCSMCWMSPPRGCTPGTPSGWWCCCGPCGTRAAGCWWWSTTGR